MRQLFALYKQPQNSQLTTMFVHVCLLQGLGALVVRVDAADILHKLFWGGGAVSLATSSADFHVLKCRPADKLEDGTVNFLDIISLKVCAGAACADTVVVCELAVFCMCRGSACEDIACADAACAGAACAAAAAAAGAGAACASSYV
jgi:hypothetical protein